MRERDPTRVFARSISPEGRGRRSITADDDYFKSSPIQLRSCRAQYRATVPVYRFMRPPLCLERLGAKQKTRLRADFYRIPHATIL